MTRVRLKLPETFGFGTDIPIRITDLNYGAHLGNDTLLSLLHEARARFLSEHGFSERHIGNAGMIMIDAMIEYRAESYYGDVLRIEVGLDEFGKSSCAFFFRVTNRESNQEVARARIGMAFFDYTRRKVTTMPEIFHTRCKPQHGSFPENEVEDLQFTTDPPAEENS